MIGATMAYYNLTFNVIGPTLGKNPLLAYINQEFVAIKWNFFARTLSGLIVTCSQRGWVGRQQAHLSLGPLGFAEGSSTASLFLRSAPPPIARDHQRELNRFLNDERKSRYICGHTKSLKSCLTATL